MFEQININLPVTIEKEKIQASRFGDAEGITHEFQEVNDEFIHIVQRSLEELFPNLIAEHENKVELAEIIRNTNLIAESTGSVSPVEIQHEDKKLFGIFKPVDSESAAIHSTYGRYRLAPFEAMAYQVSKHFDLDLVPPTVFRKIGDSYGSLQLFLDPIRFGTVANVFPEDDYAERLWDNPDYHAMAAFDYIIQMPDRHAANYLIRADLEGMHFSDRDKLIEPDYNIIDGAANAHLIAIDNGLSFSRNIYSQYNIEQYRFGGVQGPGRTFTAEMQKIPGGGVRGRKLSEAARLPTDLQEKVTRGWERRKDLFESLEPIFANAYEKQLNLDYYFDRTKSEIEQNVKDLMTTGRHCSIFNMK